MHAKALLRKYLEQRREAGETELLLESLPAADALKILASGPTSGWREALRAAGAPVTAPIAAPAPSKRYEFPRPMDVETPQDPKSVDTGFTAGLVIGRRDKSEPPDEAVGNLRSIADIVKMVAECRRCSLGETATHPVPGEGNPEAKLVCVGEAPGKNEDATGRPFIGQSGELLTKILAAIDLRREDVFICNVLKHRPPENRDPLPDEVKACSPYLLRQLELIKPKVIVAFGTFAAQTLLETKTPIGKLRGLVHRYHGTPLVVTYHPAALLRNPAWKRPTWDDVKLARRILDSPATA